MDFKTVNIVINDEVAEKMEDRGVREEDVREVLEYAETSGKKLYVEGEEHFLARKRMGNFSAYVEYKMNADEIELIDVYSHMVKLAADE